MAARQPKQWTFEVEGNRPFPIDMLRYDGARPATSLSSKSIEQTFTAERITRTIRLVTDYHAPTEGRWASFGWPVVRKL